MTIWKVSLSVDRVVNGDVVRVILGCRCKRTNNFCLQTSVPRRYVGQDAGCTLQLSSATKSQRSSCHAIGMNVTKRHWRLASEAPSVNGVSRPLPSRNPSPITPSMAGLRNKIMWRRAAWARVYKSRQATAFIPQIISHLVKILTDVRRKPLAIVSTNIPFSRWTGKCPN